MFFLKGIVFDGSSIWMAVVVGLNKISPGSPLQAKQGGHYLAAISLSQNQKREATCRLMR